MAVKLYPNENRLQQIFETELFLQKSTSHHLVLHITATKGLIVILERLKFRNALTSKMYNSIALVHKTSNTFISDHLPRHFFGL